MLRRRRAAELDWRELDDGSPDDVEVGRQVAVHHRFAEGSESGEEIALRVARHHAALRDLEVLEAEAVRARPRIARQVLDHVVQVLELHALHARSTIHRLDPRLPLLRMLRAQLGTDRIVVKVAEAITLHKLQGFGDTALTNQPDHRLELRGSRTITAAVTTKSIAQVTLPARDERRTVTQFPKLQATLNRPVKTIATAIIPLQAKKELREGEEPLQSTLQARLVARRERRTHLPHGRGVGTEEPILEGRGDATHDLEL